MWVRSFTDSDLPDNDNIVPFENTTSAERIDQINRSGIFEEYKIVSVRQIWINKRTHTHRSTKKKIPHSGGVPEVPS